MNGRLQQFLSAENLTQTQFADTIGVARASISHILAGRNKPGFEFIESMARHFPALNIEWFITGKGKMYKSASDRPEMDITELFTEQPTIVTMPVAEPESRAGNQQTNNSITESITLDKQSKSTNNQRKVSKVMLFYTDGSFEEFAKNPE